jgi:hypothetical protein
MECIAVFALLNEDTQSQLKDTLKRTGQLW